MSADNSRSQKQTGVIMKEIVLLAGVLGLFLSGCAFTTDRIDLSYSPQPGITKIPNANNVMVNVQVNDQRLEKSNKVSSKKNGYGMETAPILANEELTATIRKALEQELQSRGFIIGNEAIVSIITDLSRFWNEFKVGFFAGDAIADLNMNVMVKNKKGAILYNRNIQVQGIEPNIQLASGDNARTALDNALRKGVMSLFEDQSFINALLSAKSLPGVDDAAVPEKKEPVLKKKENLDALLKEL